MAKKLKKQKTKAGEFTVKEMPKGTIRILTKPSKEFIEEKGKLADIVKVE